MNSRYDETVKFVEIVGKHWNSHS